MTTALEKLANVIDALPLSTTCTLTINEPFTPPTEFEWDGDMMPNLKALVAEWREMDADRKAVIASHKRLVQCLEKATGKDSLFVP